MPLKPWHAYYNWVCKGCHRRGHKHFSVKSNAVDGGRGYHAQCTCGLMNQILRK